LTVLEALPTADDRVRARCRDFIQVSFRSLSMLSANTLPTG